MPTKPPTAQRNPWDDLAERCQLDARQFVRSAISRSLLDGHPMPTGSVIAAIDAMADLYGGLMAKHARIEAALTSSSRGWLARLFGGRGARS